MRKCIINDFSDYMIYENGNVYSNKRNKFLKPSLNRDNGYLRVCLSNEIKEKRCSIHRLIAIHFIPNPENKPEINHINGIKTDNRIENLEWATSRENHLHAYRTGLSKISDLCKKKVIEKNKSNCDDKHYLSIKVINLKTGKIHNTIKSASIEHGITLSSLARILRGERVNNTPYVIYKNNSSLN